MNHVEQNLTNDIVLLLLREDLHARAIAGALSRSHATVLRKLRELTEGNIADFHIEGKNNVYFLKRTLEGRNAAMIAELYRGSLALSRYPILRKISRFILEDPEIPLAILYGSYAKGLTTRQSDIDLYIDTTDPGIAKRVRQQSPSLSVKIGRFDPDDLLIREIMKDHVILKGVEMYFDKTGFLEKTA